MPALGRHLVGVMEAIKGVVFLLEEGMIPGWYQKELFIPQ